MQNPPAAERTDRRIALGLFVLAFATYAYFYGGWGANQEVNYALTRAVVEGRTFEVDRFTVPEGDIATGRGGHRFSNKPPGLSMLGVVPYSLQYALQRRRVISFRDYWRTNKQLVTIAVCGICGAFIPVVLFLYGRRLGVSRSAAARVAIVIALGTIVFPYSTMLFAHVPSTLFLLLAFVLLDTRPLLAGAAAGIAGCCFLISAIAAIVLLIWALRLSVRKALWFIAGGVPFAAALALYQWICFGSPLVTSLERSSSYTERGLLLGVFGNVRAEALWHLTFSEYRGLFFISPVLLFAFAGAFIALRRRQCTAQWIVIGAISLIFVFANASFNGWHGGAAFGPRYLLPIIPLLGIAMMFAAHRFGWLWLAAGIVSVAINLAAVAVDPMPLDGMKHPLTGRILRSGRVSIGEETRNLGEPLFGQGSWISILPAVVWMVAAGGVILRVAGEDGPGPEARVR